LGNPGPPFGGEFPVGENSPFPPFAWETPPQNPPWPLGNPPFGGALSREPFSPKKTLPFKFPSFFLKTPILLSPIHPVLKVSPPIERFPPKGGFFTYPTTNLQALNL